MLHREVLVVLDLPLPEEEPRFGDWFEHLMVLAIAVNVVILALYDPYEDPHSSRYRILFTMQVVLTLIFQCEIAIRLVALGWRRMIHPVRFVDALLVMLCTGAVFAEFAGKPNRLFGFTIVRSLRVLRPLKALGALPSLIVLIDALSHIVFKAFDVSLLFFSFLMIFSVAGLNLFMGELQTRCVNQRYHNLSWVNDTYRYNATNIANFVCGGPFDTTVLNLSTTIACNPQQLCDEGSLASFLPRGFQCPFGYDCLEVKELDDGFIGFNNFVQSYFTMFVASSGQVWFSLVGQAADVTDVVAWPFMCLFFLCCVFLVSLMIVVITVDFEVARTKAEQTYAEQSNKIALGMTKFQSLVQTLIKTKRNEAAGGSSAGSTTTAGAQAGSAVDAKGKATTTSSAAAVGTASKSAAPSATAMSPTAPPRRKNEDDDDHDELSPSSALVFQSVREFVAENIVYTQFFDWSSKFLILINIILMAYIHYDMPESVATAFAQINIYLVVLFCLETLLRFIATPLGVFVSEKMNLFDIVINIVSVVDIALNLSALKFLQLLRVFRTVRLMRFSPGFYKMLLFIYSSVKSSPLILILLFFVVFIFAIIGMQLLGGKMCGLVTGPDGDNTDARCPQRPRCHFDTFSGALLSSFIIITGDDWDTIMYNAMRVSGNGIGLLFVLYFYLGNYILLSLFVGILLSAKTDGQVDQMNQADSEQADDQRKANRGRGISTIARIVDAAVIQTVNPATSAKAPTAVDLHLSKSAIAFEKKRELREAKAVSRLNKKQQEPPMSPSNFFSSIFSKSETASGDQPTNAAARRVDPNASTSGDIEMSATITAQKSSGEFQRSDDDDDDSNPSDMDDSDDDGDVKYENETEEDFHKRRERRRKLRHPGMDNFMATMATPSKLKVFRAKCVAVLQPMITHRIYSYVSGAIIMTACVAIALSDPLGAPDVTINRVVDIIDTTVKVFFVLDTLLNMFVFGVVGDKTSYLRKNGWNVFDFFLSLVSLAALILKGTVKNADGYLTSLLALRPLTLVRRSPSMNLVVRSLGTAIFEMRFVTMAIFGAVFTIAIMGVQLFSGKMRECHINFVAVPEYNVTRCLELGGKWSNSGANFDNVLEALFSLFVSLTLEMWITIMFRAMDYVGPGQAPVVNENSAAAVFFVIFVVLGGMLFVNLFMSVLVGSYNRSKRSVGAQRSLLTQREQNGWMATNKRIMRVLPNDAKVEMVQLEGLMAETLLGGFDKAMRFGGLDKAIKAITDEKNVVNRGMASLLTRARLTTRDWVESRWWFYATVLLTVFNFVVMVMDYDPSPPSYSSTLQILEDSFTILFALEAIVKIIGEGFSRYIASNWNRLDLFVVVISAFGFGFRSVVNARIIALFRAFRILRLAKLLQGKSSLGELIHKFGVAVASLGPAFAVILICMFMFGTLAKEIFGRMRWVYDGFDAIGPNSNFAYIGIAMFMLYRVTFGGDWLQLVISMAPSPLNCDRNLGDCGPSLWVTKLFFVVFLCFSMFVLRNLLVAVLVDSFSSAADIRGIKKPHAHTLVKVWQAADPKWSMRIRGFDVLTLVRALPPSCPIGFRSHNPGQRIGLELRLLYMLRIRDPASYEEGVKFTDLIDLLCHFAYMAPAPELRIFRKKLPVVTDDEARMSASVIMINEVAKRVIAVRRQRKKQQLQQQQDLSGGSALQAELPEFDDDDEDDDVTIRRMEDKSSARSTSRRSSIATPPPDAGGHGTGGSISEQRRRGLTMVQAGRRVADPFSSPIHRFEQMSILPQFFFSHDFDSDEDDETATAASPTATNAEAAAPSASHQQQGTAGYVPPTPPATTTTTTTTPVMTAISIVSPSMAPPLTLATLRRASLDTSSSSTARRHQEVDPTRRRWADDSTDDDDDDDGKSDSSTATNEYFERLMIRAQRDQPPELHDAEQGTDLAARLLVHRMEKDI